MNVRMEVDQWAPLPEKIVLAQLNSLASQKNGIATVMHLREKTIHKLAELSKKPAEAGRSLTGVDYYPLSEPNAVNEKSILNLDQILKHWLSAVFCVASIETKRVTWHTSTGETLEKVATEDAVLQRVRSIQELKRRLDNGRRCIALFHISMPSDPLAFVHIALTREIAPTLKYLTSHASEAEPPTHAMFYSVNSPHEALSGLDLATKVIKNASVEIKREFPSVHTFCTLSPIPGFMKWLTSRVKSNGTSASLPILYLPARHRKAIDKAAGSPFENDHQAICWTLTQITCPDWTKRSDLVEPLEGPLTWLVAHYLAQEKSAGLPLDPVARFHLRNGASLHRVNWMGNVSSSGLKSSAGFMVNYLYDMEHLEDRSDEFIATNGKFHMSDEIKKMLANHQI